VSDNEVMYLRVRAVILLCSILGLSLPLLAQNTVSIAVFPLVSTGMPADSPGTIPSDTVASLIRNDVKASQSGPFTVTPITDAPADFDPGVPPDADACQGASYALTSQLFYDSGQQQSQGQVWLYDNSTETLVGTDQFIYANSDEAVETAPFLIDYILGLIPTYTVNVSVEPPGGGSVTDKDNKNALAQGSYIQHGYGALSFNAKPAPGFSFQGWQINDNKTLNTANPLKLTLNAKTYPGKAGPDDPWGTKITVNVKAVFRIGVQRATSKSARRQLNWFAGGGWHSYIPVITSSFKFFNKPWYPVGLSAKAGLEPWREEWGGLGFQFQTSYGYLRSNHDYKYSMNFIQFGLHTFYNMPPLGNFCFGAILGGGYELMVGQAVRDNTSKIIWNNDKAGFYPFFSAGIYGNIDLNSKLFLEIGIEWNMLFYNDRKDNSAGTLAYINPWLSLGYFF
jgi:hypothetical protein